MRACGQDKLGGGLSPLMHGRWLQCASYTSSRRQFPVQLLRRCCCLLCHVAQIWICGGRRTLLGRSPHVGVHSFVSDFEVTVREETGWGTKQTAADTVSSLYTTFILPRSSAFIWCLAGFNFRARLNGANSENHLVLVHDFQLLVGVWLDLISERDWTGQITNTGSFLVHHFHIAEVFNFPLKLCESRGGRPGLPSLINLRFLWR